MKHLSYVPVIIPVLVIFFGCAGSAEKTDGDDAATNIANEGGHLIPTMVSKAGELTIYGDERLTRPIGSLAADEFFLADMIIFEDIWREQSKEMIYIRSAHITSPEGVSGYVDFLKLEEVRSIWAKKLNVRNEPSLSGKVIATVERGDSVLISTEGECEFGPVWGDDGFSWREVRVNGITGWLAEEYLIEKRFFDVLEPALQKYESGDTSGMQKYLSDLSGRYSDVEVLPAPDGKTAAVIFRIFESKWASESTVYLVGEPDLRVYAYTVFECCFSPGGDYTYIHYMFPTYGAGYYYTYPVVVINNRNGEEAVASSIYPYSFSSLVDDSDYYHLNREFVDDEYLLLVTHSSPPIEKEKYFNRGFPYLELINLSTGTSTALLEPDMDTLNDLPELSIKFGVKLKRVSGFDASSEAVKRAMDTELFKRCDGKVVYGFETEA